MNLTSFWRPSLRVIPVEKRLGGHEHQEYDVGGDEAEELVEGGPPGAGEAAGGRQDVDERQHRQEEHVGQQAQQLGEEVEGAPVVEALQPRRPHHLLGVVMRQELQGEGWWLLE